MERDTNGVTRKDLRTMRLGERRAFPLPNVEAIECARATASQMARLENCQYKCNADYLRRIVIIEKLRAT